MRMPHGYFKRVRITRPVLTMSSNEGTFPGQPVADNVRTFMVEQPKVRGTQAGGMVVRAASFVFASKVDVQERDFIEIPGDTTFQVSETTPGPLQSVVSAEEVPSK